MPRFIFFSFLLWRILLFLPVIIGEMYLKYRPGYNYTSILKFAILYFPVTSYLLHVWANFDGLHYLFIAANGYTNNYGFFPLYPLLIKFLSIIFGSTKPFDNAQFFSAFFISNISFLFSLIVFYKLMSLDYSSKQTKLIILSLLVFPTSFFFASIYSESLFLLLTLLSFYFMRKRKWLIASLFASLASLTRIVGIFLLPALIFEYFTFRHSGKVAKSDRIQNQKRTVILARFAARRACPESAFFIYLSPVLALFSYSFFNFLRTGDWLYFIHAQGNIGNNRSVSSIVLFPQTVVRYFKILLFVNPNLYEWWISLLELIVFFLCSILLYIAWKRKVRTSYLIFSVLSFLLPASSGTFTALSRYVLVLFPIFISLGLIEQKWIFRTYIIISTVLLFLLLMLFSKGFFVA